MRFFRYIAPAIILVATFACSGDQSSRITTFPNKFADQELVKLYDFKDRRQTEAIMPFLSHEQALYRAEGALALASVQDTTSQAGLHRLLADADLQVRKAAAFAIGQLKMPSSQSALANRLTIETEPVVRQYLLEALGKCLDAGYTHFLATYVAADALSLTGKAWGLYRAGVSGLRDSTLTRAAATLLADSVPAPARLAAAHYFSRLPGIDISDAEPALQHLAANDSIPEIRMAAARSLAKSKNDSLVYFLRARLEHESHPLVKVNLLRAVKSDHVAGLRPQLTRLLTGSEYQTSVAVGELVQSFRGNENDRWLWEIQPMIPIARSRSLVLGKLLDNYQYAYNAYRELSDMLEAEASPYNRGFMLQALGGYFNASALLAGYLRAPHPFERTSAMEALSTMNQAQDFPAYKQAELASYYRQGVLSGDAGQVTVAASALIRQKDRVRPYLSNIDFLYQGLDSLQLPEDLEPYQALERAISTYRNQPTPASPQLYQNPIQWETAKTIRKGATALVETGRGVIEFELLVEEAPGSVENFVALATAGFYSGVAFHRVVPNFVVQAGCPRGDGYGSSDGVIRSEFSTTKYGTGYVGMASAGKDTEGSQWFITHSPTPHLDGSYTIFGRVTKGMEVVNSIEVGDTILSVTLR